MLLQLFFEILDGEEGFDCIEIFVIFADAALYFSVMAWRVWLDFLVMDLLL